MGTKVLIVEEDDGWAVFDAEKGSLITEGLLDMEESLKFCDEMKFQTPYMGESGKFFEDLNGEPLYRIEDTSAKDVALQYSDGTPFLDFELCPTCKGPAIGRPNAGHNCYYCAECDKDIDCVPPPEWIGEAD